MTEVKIEIDKLTSMLVSYHILCAPTRRNKQHNPGVFDNLSVSAEERGQYLSYWISKGFTLDNLDLIRTQLFYPECDSLDGLFNLLGAEISPEIRKNLIAFENRFEPYFESVRQQVMPFIESRKNEAVELIDKIYTLAQQMTGVCIERPQELDIRIVEGIAPSSLGSEVNRGIGYIVEQVRNFLSKKNNFLFTLIHESVAHHTAEGSRKDIQDIFGKNIYEVEEGFAKLFSKKVAEKIIGQEVDYAANTGLENLSYSTFERKWDSLNGNNFREWYICCLTEIRDRYRQNN